MDRVRFAFVKDVELNNWLPTFSLETLDERLRALGDVVPCSLFPLPKDPVSQSGLMRFVSTTFAPR